MSLSGNDLLLRVNGIQPAFGIEFGFASPRADEIRAADPYRQANVSFSLVQRSAGRPTRHTLIDCGMGVVPSLLEFEQSHGVSVVSEVLLTHPHLDHFGQLDWLSMCLLRNSGYEDREHPQDRVSGPMSRQQFRVELDRVRGPHDIRLAEHGMVLAWE